MRPIGFSTGAIARGDYRAGLDALRLRGIKAVEISALRLCELEPLVMHLRDLDLSGFSFVSFHAPSRFEAADEALVVQQLMQVAGAGIPVVVHPDVIYNDRRWSGFAGDLFIVNMDKRKPTGRTAAELAGWFDRFPLAGLCFDIGHARQVDPTMIEARRILQQHGARLRQVHISDVNTASRHEPLSDYAVRAFQRVAWMIPMEVPVILETLIDEGQSDIDAEVRQAERSLSGVAEAIAIAG